jgi:hypothetical protein
LGDLGFTGRVSVRDLWAHRDAAMGAKSWSPLLPPHGAGLYQVNPL